ncbi:LuxR C-terminal-related transcriptional regulator [Streptomyces sp. SID5789]|uniref:helix-turn-helix transcriptional regulator n=1 Tax=Streptomyces sp. SID5789 TaxID=2690310 RepID=UPI001370A2E3|nr:LuxR C-terminal-related transcriptional regulator [Streptomyces sp. SID5789]MZE70932.1 transcriptional regulator [Streptomyces sp. SID5789]
MLDVLGISAFDEGVYRALLTRAGSDAAALSHVVESTPTRVTQALRRLAALGLAHREVPGHWEATGPRSTLTALLNRRRAEAVSAFSEIEAVVDALHGMYRAGRFRDNPGDLVEVLTGKESVARRVAELSASLSTHFWILDRPPYLDRLNGQPYDGSTETAVTRAWLDRGVDIRSIYCPDSMAYPGRFETVLTLSALGERSRMLPELPFKLHIFDRRTAVMPLTGSVYDSIVVVHASGLLDALIELFEAYWNRAEPLLGDGTPAGGGGRAVEGVPSEADVVLLRMLHHGLKDQAIARQLGVSQRTATRRVAALMERLGARTRFQAGANARELGWLEL